MIEFLSKPWPWYVAGVLFGLAVPALLLIGNKAFGVSSSLRHICAACLPERFSYFKYNWKKETWNLFFISGILIGGFIAGYFLKNPAAPDIAAHTKQVLNQQGITDFNHLIPVELFNFKSLFKFKGFVLIVVGGFMVGFGTRYAGGCTSGHSIMGLSNLQWPSLVATICFMIGGFVATWFILPYLLG